MIQIAALRSRLEKQPTDLRRNPRDLGDGARAVGRDFRGLPYAEAHGRPPDRSDEFDAGYGPANTSQFALAFSMLLSILVLNSFNAP